MGRILSFRNYQSLERAVGTTLCQNEAEVKFPMDIDHLISVTMSIEKFTSVSFWQRVTATSHFNMRQKRQKKAGSIACLKVWQEALIRRMVVQDSGLYRESVRGHRTPPPL